MEFIEVSAKTVDDAIPKNPELPSLMTWISSLSLAA